MMKPAKLCDDLLSADYGPSYFRTYGGPLGYDRAVPHWGIFFGGIAETIIRSFRPSRVFDAGCAMGFLVEAFWDRGVEAWGRDISEFAISQVRADLRDFCCVGSIADPIEGRFDLITCIEVLEHMPEAAAVQAIEAMTAATDRILFSSSPRDLQEPTHINVKPTIYWLRLFAARGFAPLLSYDPTFVSPQCIVLERVAQPSGEQILLGYSEIVRLRLQRADKEAVEQERQAVRRELAALNAKHAEELDESRRKLAVMTDTLSRLERDHNIVLTSTSWRMTYAVRRLTARATPRQRRLIRASASIVWWSLTLQLRSRLRQQREQARTIANAHSTAIPDIEAPEKQTSDQALEATIATPTTTHHFGYDIPTHLMNLTGGGPDTFEAISNHHIMTLQEHVPIQCGYSIIEIGCGIGRDAIPLTSIIGADGQYLGIDIIKNSIDWCTANISARHPNFRFVHFDIADQLHNPHGSMPTTAFSLPAVDRSVDCVIVWSVFTHITKDDIVHYLREFARVLRPSGKVFATWFIVNDEVLAKAKTVDLTPFKLRFEHQIDDGCFVNDLQFPMGAVAYTREWVLSAIQSTGFELSVDIMPGAWSGYWSKPTDGQDVTILTLPSCTICQTPG
jgi:SAM-dependent methyltransferase